MRTSLAAWGTVLGGALLATAGLAIRATSLTQRAAPPVAERPEHDDRSWKRLLDGSLVGDLESAGERRRALEDLMKVRDWLKAEYRRLQEPAASLFDSRLATVFERLRPFLTPSEPLRPEALQAFAALSPFASPTGRAQEAGRTAGPDLAAIASNPAEERQDRAYAIEALGDLQAGGPTLIALLADEGTLLQLRALAAQSLGRSAEGAVALTRALGDPQTSRLLGEAVFDGLCRVPERCAGILEHRNPHYRLQAAFTLVWHYRRSDPRILPMVKTALRDPGRCETAQFLAAELGAAALDAVIEAAEAPGDCQVGSIRALARMREVALPALPALDRLDADGSSPVHNEIRAAREAIGPPLKKRLLGLDAPDPRAREQALAGIRLVIRGRGAEGVPVPKLTALMQRDPSESVRAEATNTLAALGPAAREALPSFFLALRDSSPQVRWSAALALEAVVRDGPAPDVERALKALLVALDDPSSDVRASAAHSAGQLGSRWVVPLRDTEVLRELERSLTRHGEDADPHTRSLARQGLAAIQSARERP